MKLFTRILLFLTMSICSSISAQEVRTNPRLLPQYREPVYTNANVDNKNVVNASIVKNSIQYNSALSSQLIKNPMAIEQMENFVYNAIGKKAFPGCQILAIKDGTVIYHKAFGTLEYGTQNADTATLYDIASVTKLATTLAVMKLYEEGKINLEGSLMAYLPMTVGTDKAFLKIKDLLMHQAGLKAWIPFYKYTIDSTSKLPTKRFYSVQETSNFNIPVAKNLYTSKRLIDTIWTMILSSELSNKGKYVYSDLDLLFLEKVIVQATGMPLDMYINKFFFKPMGLTSITYNPWESKTLRKIAPTEKDYYFRQQTLRGYVHDQAASMLGGVAGHAGLFSTAMDMGAIMQMLIDNGSYNGKQYLKKETIALFTGYRSNISRRGYGFDKPDKEKGKGGPAADACSKRSFGHQGFTGTCAWADPEHNLVFVFLSNRVYPTADNTLINKLSVRTETQQYFYKALGIAK